MLNIKDLEVGYGGSTVLRGVSLAVEPGKVVCLMGRNGVGKTTLLKSIIGLLRPQRGKLVFNDWDMTRATPDKRARAGVGYVPQGREIFPQLTVEENLILGLEASRQRGKVAPPKSQKYGSVPDFVVELFPLLGRVLPHKGGQLSGGQQQQLAIGRALMAQPSLLMLDEPMEGIQPSVVSEIEHAIETLKAKRETSILLIEQGLSFATRIADYYYVMDHGSIVAQGSPAEISEAELKKYLTV